jgi:hypothetical protein
VKNIGMGRRIGLQEFKWQHRGIERKVTFERITGPPGLEKVRGLDTFATFLSLPKSH